ncbi:MAG TPA: acyl-CoA dehydrogenase family protein [Solirubrobacterales bacterium]|jgi:alkylation response protein AidB-like acyl-CoA dehydrogenase|nr:acyl-CoA dehydrogenase family protein [Solirubrobacterales bacterium]
MDFSFSEDQRELRAIVAAFLERHATSQQVRAAAESDGFAAEQWARLTGEMELTGLAVAPELGGAGASYVEVGIAVEELGRTLLPVPYLSTVTAAAVLSHVAGDDAAGPLLERIAGGAAAAVGLDDDGALHIRGDDAGGDSLHLDGEIFVVDGGTAELFVLAARRGDVPVLVAVEAGAPGCAVEPLATLDQTRRQAAVRLDGAPATLLATGPEALARARDLLSVGLAVESVGAAARCLDETVAYLKERVQFGRPIGSFQALKHRCADLATELEAARSTAYYATWVVDGAPEELAVVAPLAEAVAGAALLHVAAEAIQMHGGIGFTWEHDAHMYLKRAKANELLAGGYRGLRRLVAERAGILG